MHFTHIRRRILKIKPSVGNANLDNNDGKPITLIVDASGLTITKKGDYLEHKWIRKKRVCRLYPLTPGGSLAQSAVLFLHLLRSPFHSITLGSGFFQKRTE